MYGKSWLLFEIHLLRILVSNNITLLLEARAILDTDKIEKLIERVKEVINRGEMDTSMWMCAASLAYHGVLGSVDDLFLLNVNLSQVPAQHLASLASCVTNYLSINNVSGCDLVTILSSVKCHLLIIIRQSLGREETRALVQAMESGVTEVRLYDEVTLDIETLTEYSGQGVCREVVIMGDTAGRYREKMRTWANSRNWRLEYDKEKFLFLIY